MLEKKIELKGLRVQDVGTTCIMLVSKFSRTIHAKHGVVIQLHKPRVLNTVAAYAAATNDDQLKAIYGQIEYEIRQHIKKTHPRSYDTVSLRYDRKSALESRHSQNQ